MTTPQPRPAPDNRLRLRLWIDGALIDEAWIDSTDPDAPAKVDAVHAVHTHLAELANAHGVPWLTEVYNPEAPDEEAYIRVGTDKAGMVQPLAGSLHTLLANLDDHLNGSL
jgi:hypothetical protein